MTKFCFNQIQNLGLLNVDELPSFEEHGSIGEVSL
jgi:hypothetical protein